MWAQENCLNFPDNSQIARRTKNFTGCIEAARRQMRAVWGRNGSWYWSCVLKYGMKCEWTWRTKWLMVPSAPSLTNIRDSIAKWNSLADGRFKRFTRFIPAPSFLFPLGLLLFSRAPYFSSHFMCSKTMHSGARKRQLNCVSISHECARSSVFRLSKIRFAFSSIFQCRIACCDAPYSTVEFSVFAVSSSTYSIYYLRRHHHYTIQTIHALDGMAWATRLKDKSPLSSTLSTFNTAHPIHPTEWVNE